MWIDGHCHLAHPELDGLRVEWEQRAITSGIHHFVQGGIGPEDWQRQREFATRNWSLTFGLHPWFVINEPEAALDEALSRLPEFLKFGVGLGELGLDYSDKSAASHESKQLHYFEQQLIIAKQGKWPIVLHVVQAHGRALDLLGKVAREWRGIVHGFTGSLETAKRYRKLGLHISVGPAVTRTGYQKLKRAVKELSMDALTLESDCPNVSIPGDIGRPTSLIDVANAVSAIRGCQASELLHQSSMRLRDIFDLDVCFSLD